MIQALPAGNALTLEIKYAFIQFSQPALSINKYCPGLIQSLEKSAET